MPASSLRQVASANARSVFAQIIRSYRRNGHVTAARAIVRHARECGTYPAPIRHWPSR
ncbi:MAG TPA: hypothetical protein VHE61_20950 [Opitutaceae bacterium]|nr:hypothetical protein [Opitutaceae bacterium]